MKWNQFRAKPILLKDWGVKCLPTHRWHICIFADIQSQTKIAKEPQSQRTTTDQMNGQITYRQEGRTDNKVLAIGGLTCFISTEVQNSTFVLRINSSDKNPAHRQYPNR